MFIITCPDNCREERRWIIDTIFCEFLGLEYEILWSQENRVTIEASQRSLAMPDIFFEAAACDWLGSLTLPNLPLTTWRPQEFVRNSILSNDIPIIYGDGEFSASEYQVYLNIDVLGSAFFMLSRYEELVCDAKDQHHRFPASRSVAFKEGFLNRPIVNEYVEILWACMKLLWPNLSRRKRDFQMIVSADVDHPLNPAASKIIRQLLQTGRDILIRRDIDRAINGVKNYYFSKSGDYSFDTYFAQFNWMMQVNEEAGNNICFYFMAGHNNKKYDGDYALENPALLGLMKEISSRGHEIGLHPSYDTCNNKALLLSEVDNILRQLEKTGAKQDRLGSRQHYLRWIPNTTSVLLNDVGLDYDSTISFADQIGFRSGCCYEYTLFDLQGRRRLKLRERPLVIMEVTLFQYMKDQLSPRGIEDCIQVYKSICKKFSGDFTLLWHNSSLLTNSDREIYKSIL